MSKIRDRRGKTSWSSKNDRLCRLCKDEVENEINFMLQCLVYETLRQKYLPRVTQRQLSIMSQHIYAMHLTYAKSYLKAHESISLDVMIN